MRVMLDTNVLISMALFSSKQFSEMLSFIAKEHTLVLSSFVVEELMDVVERKFPTKTNAMDRFLEKLSYELVYTPHQMKSGLFQIRDMKDYPVLYTAVIENVDILLTGDKDFLDIEVEKPEILTPSEFMTKFYKA